MMEARVCASCCWRREVLIGTASGGAPYHWCGHILSPFYAGGVGETDGCDKHHPRDRPFIAATAVHAPERAR